MKQEYLIISDIHNQVDKAEEIIRDHGKDRVVIFLGDYFDNFGDSPSDAKNTAEWLLYSLHKPSRIHLMGNHDAPYRWSVTQCPGWTVRKHREVLRVLKKQDWERIKLYHVIERFPRPLILSHAGFTLQNVYDIRDEADLWVGGRSRGVADTTPGEIISEIGRQSDICIQKANNQEYHHFMSMGSRMGVSRPGGPWWVDKVWFAAINGIDQMVGHTPLHEPVAHTSTSVEATTLFVDCQLRCAAIIAEESVTFVERNQSLCVYSNSAAPMPTPAWAPPL
jgi:hypothetical protein